MRQRASVTQKVPETPHAFYLSLINSILPENALKGL